MIILDTHIWIWLVNGNFDKFPQEWLTQIESENRVVISPVSCYEFALAHSRGRLNLSGSSKDWIESALSPFGIELIPITEKVAVRAVDLTPVHRDPFDRLIIATALEYEAKLASVDGLYPQYPELAGYLLT